MLFKKRLRKNAWLLFTLCVSGIFGQSSKLDSLAAILRSNANDTSKARAYFQATELFFFRKPDTILYLCNKGLAIVEKNLRSANSRENRSYLKTKADLLNNLGVFYYTQGDIQRSMETHFNGLKIKEQLKDTKGSVSSYIEIATAFKAENKYDSALKYLNKCLALTLKPEYKKERAGTLHSIGALHLERDNSDSAMKYEKQALALFSEVSDIQKTGECYNNIGNVYYNRGNIAKAIENIEKYLKIVESIDDLSGMTAALNNLGSLYCTQHDTSKCLDYLERALKIREQSGIKNRKSTELNNIGSIYMMQKKLEKAKTYFIRALKADSASGNKKAIAHSMSNLGLCYQFEENNPKAIEIFERCKLIYDQIEDREGQATLLVRLGKAYCKEKNFSRALELANESFSLYKQIKFLEGIGNSAELLYDVYRKTNNYEKALYNYRVYIHIRDTISNIRNNKIALRSALKYEFDKKQVADSIKVAEERKVTEAKFEQEKTQRYALYGGLILVLIFSIFIFNRFKVTQRQKFLIEEQKSNLESKNHIIEEKQNEILASIRYAERIQKAQMPNETFIKKSLEKLTKK